MNHKGFALLMFSMILLAEVSFIIAGSLSLYNVNSYQRMSFEEKLASIRAQSFSTTTYDYFQLIGLSFVLLSACQFLFILKYWRLSMRLEVASRINTFDWKRIAFWQNLLLFVPLSIITAATAWWVYDQLQSLVYTYCPSSTYIYGLGIFLNTFPQVVLLLIQLDTVRRFKRIEDSMHLFRVNKI
jgi:hypothetical protein